MNLVQRIAINAGWQMFVHIGGLAASLGSIILLTRYFGVRGFGEYTTIITFVLLVSALSDFGLTLFMTREFARHGQRATVLFYNTLALRLTLSVALVLAVLVAVPFLPYTLTVRMGIALYSLATVFLAFSSLITSIAQATLRMGRPVAADLANRLVALGVIIWVVNSRQSLLHLIGGLVVAHAVQLAVLVALSRTLVPLRLRVDFSMWRDVTRRALPFAATAVLAVVYARGDTLILSFFYNPSFTPDVGIYGVAYRVIDALLILPVAFVGSVFPILAKTGSENLSRTRVIDEAFRVLAILALPVFLGGTLLAGPLMRAVAGRTFVELQPISVPVLGSVVAPPSALALQILLVALLFMFFGLLNGHLLVASDEQQTLLRIFSGVVVLNILLCLILIPRYSFVGAGIATATTEIVGYLWTTVALAQRGLRLPWRYLMHPSGAAVAMSAVVSLVSILTGAHVISLIIIGGLAYAGILYLSGGLPRDLLMAIFTREDA